ncbi:hypothetical protein [Candidatus Merdisoma sp. JLR.KK006]|uniref:hypothetical protein n=1 Tax=Candidatus Merdisoma sp. JLR.KK006 TaxID=3112626 RepID=UPI002FF0CD7C
MGLAFEPYKILKNYGKSFEKLYPILSEREAIFQNLLDADDSWDVREQGEEEKKHANVQFAFNSGSASGHFLALARKRLGERAQAVIQ